MNIINISEIKDKKFFNFGAYSNVYIVSINGKNYVYKEYKEVINPIVKNIIAELTDEEYSDSFLTPIYLVESLNHKKILGCLSKYDKCLTEIDNVCDYPKRIELLKNAKMVLEKWHNESKRIHGDINIGNILVDEKNTKPYLIDFDTSLKLNTKFNKNYDIDDFPFSDYIYEYLAYYPFDEGIDTFLFNLTTLQLLVDPDYLSLTKKIRFDKLGIENKDVKRLSKQLLFYDTKKSFDKDYIIDYID